MDKVTFNYLTDEEPMKFDAHSVITKDTIYTYIGMDFGYNDKTSYWIYDPRTDEHHEITKEEYDRVMKCQRK